MNELQEPCPRAVAGALAQAVESMPVVVVTGPRQAGKSTLVRGLGGRRYVTLDDLDVLHRAKEEPRGLLSDGDLTLDEAQRVPDLLLEVKRQVDRRRRRGQFVVTGSAHLLLMKAVADSLAGRAAWLRLLPMTRSEQQGLGRAGRWSELWSSPDAEWATLLENGAARAEDWRALARRGGYPDPALHLGGEAERATWFRGYEQSWLERDLRDLSQISSIVQFRRLAQAACLRLGGLVNQTDLARDIAMNQPTVHRWLDLMEISWHLVRLPAFAIDRTKRLIKAPKLYWSDVGLALHLSGEEEPRGAHLENLVLIDLMTWRESEAPGAQVTHWRTAAGAEVDFVVEWKRSLLPVEVKATRRPRLEDARGLQSFLGEHPRSRAGLLLHGGDETTWLAERVLAVPWWRVL